MRNEENSPIIKVRKIKKNFVEENRKNSLFKKNEEKQPQIQKYGKNPRNSQV
jgi:hypothetical protein